jgi:alpha-L-arabinofuranosidase
LVVDGNAPQPEPRFPVGFDHPQVRAGSSTFPLDVIAGLSPDRRKLRIGVVNATLHSQVIELTLKGIAVSGRGTAWRLTGASLDAANRVGQASGVTIEASHVPILARSLSVPPISTIIYEFPVSIRQ